MGLTVIRRYFRYLRPYLRLVILTALAGAGALAAATAIPQVIKSVIDGPVAQHRVDRLLPYILLLLVLAATEFTCTFVRRNFTGVASFAMEADMRNEFYAHLQGLQVAFHDNWQSGQLLSRCIADINSVRRFVGFGLVFMWITIATFVVVIVMLFRLDTLLATITLLTAIPVISTSHRFFRLYRLVARRMQDQQGDLTTIIEEAATGVRIVKAFGREPQMFEQYRREADDLRGVNLEAVRIRAWLWTLLSYLPNLNLALIVLLGGFAVVQGRLSIGGLVAFISYVFMLIMPMEALGWILSMGEEAHTASDRLTDVYSAQPAIHDRPQARKIAASRGRIRFANVGFKYPGTDEWTLRGVNLEIEPGETLALVGRTGSGKSTLASLVPRLYDVTEGSLTLDGHEVSALTLSSLRAQMGVAFEEPILFSASVRENLLMGRPEADEETVRRAVSVAQAEFVWDLPWGLDTRVGEQGFSLSGGQRQRLALARAVLGSPPVLILDDPLSAVDVHTEALIEAALSTVLKGVTALLVVHRPSTLALADRAALLDGGRIVAVGTHHELMAGNELYRALLSQEAEELAS